jgi:hypothetical protein
VRTHSCATAYLVQRCIVWCNVLRCVLHGVNRTLNVACCMLRVAGVHVACCLLHGCMGACCLLHVARVHGCMLQRLLHVASAPAAELQPTRHVELGRDVRLEHCGVASSKGYGWLRIGVRNRANKGMNNAIRLGFTRR